MLKTYTVSFFGHRRIEPFFELEKQVIRLIREILDSNDYVEFLVGRNGEFDQLVSSSIRLVKRDGSGEKCSHTLVLPYESAEFQKNRQAFYKYYDEVELFSEFGKTHFKTAIQKRNREMVDRSDLVVFYLERRSGGAYQIYQYANKQGKRLLLLCADQASEGKEE